MSRFKRLNPAEIGFAVRNWLADLGYGAKLFLRLLLGTFGSWGRFGLIRDQIHFLGNYSLAISPTAHREAETAKAHRG